MTLQIDDAAAQDAQALAPGMADGINWNRTVVSDYYWNFRLSGGSGDRSIDNLYDSKWGSSVMGSAVSLTYSFATSSSVYAYSGEPSSKFAFSAGQIEAVRGALAAYAAVANLTFVETTDTASSAGDIRWGNSSSYYVPTAQAYLPSTDGAIGGDIWFGTNYDYSNARPGSYEYFTYIHELGHALGLMHPRENYLARPEPGAGRRFFPDDADAERHFCHSVSLWPEHGLPRRQRHLFMGRGPIRLRNKPYGTVAASTP